MTEPTTTDKLAMLVGGSFVLLGTVVMGTVEALIGNPSTMPVTNEAGQVVATTTFPVEARAALIALGLLVWFAAAVYTVATPRQAEEAAPAATGTAAK
jgi:ABC-type Fe3+-siderophore transport system permease subunit